MYRLVQGGLLLFVSLLVLQISPPTHSAAAAVQQVALPAHIVDSADVVANATVTSDFVIEIDTMPHTVVMLSVIDYAKGDPPPTIPVLVAGGLAADGRNVLVSHAARFRLGQQVQVALVPTSQTSLSASLQQLGAIATPLFEVKGGERGVTENAFQAHAAGVNDFVANLELKWPTFSPAASYLVNTNGSGSSAAATLAAVNRAAQAWEDDPGSIVDFDYAGPTADNGISGDNENVISFQFLPQREELALTFWYVKPDGTFEFEVVLNTRYRFSDGVVPGRYDIEMVVTHELGHVLGLGHPSQPSAYQELMFIQVPDGVRKSLGNGDRAGLRLLYPPGLPSPPCSDLAVTVDLSTGVGAPTEGDDVILGTPGPDWIWALGGNDIICGGGGIDRIFAGDGNDFVFGEGGSDRIWGDAGNDSIYAGAGADRVWGGGGSDVIFGQGGQDFLSGDAGNDVLQGNWQSDVLSGGSGNDELRGAGGKDVIYGDEGDDTLFGGLNTDYLNGGTGIDAGDGQRGRDNPLTPGVSGCEQLESADSC